MPVLPGSPVAMSAARQFSWPTIVAPRNSELPFVWSPWWWVLTSVLTGAGLTAAIWSR
jgi:hypothetical protein